VRNNLLDAELIKNVSRVRHEDIMVLSRNSKMCEIHTPMRAQGFSFKKRSKRKNRGGWVSWTFISQNPSVVEIRLGSVGKVRVRTLWEEG
jgi:hypothetical protein